MREGIVYKRVAYVSIVVAGRRGRRVRTVCCRIVMVTEVRALWENNALMVCIVSSVDTEDDSLIDNSFNRKWAVKYTREVVVYTCHLKWEKLTHCPDSWYRPSAVGGTVRHGVSAGEVVTKLTSVWMHGAANGSAARLASVDFVWLAMVSVACAG